MIDSPFFELKASDSQEPKQQTESPFFELDAPARTDSPFFELDSEPTTEAEALENVNRTAANMRKAANAYTSAGGRAFNPAVTQGSDYFRKLTPTEQAAQQQGDPVVISQAGTLQTEGPNVREIPPPLQTTPEANTPEAMSLAIEATEKWKAQKRGRIDKAFATSQGVEAQPKPVPPVRTNPKDQTIAEAIKNPEQLAKNIQWHFGIDTDVFSTLPRNQQRAIASKATQAAKADEYKKKRGVQLEESADYQAQMRKSVGVDVPAPPARSLEVGAKVGNPDTSTPVAEVPREQQVEAIYQQFKKSQAKIERDYPGAERANIAHILKSDEELRTQAERSLAAQEAETGRQARVAGTGWSEYIAQVPKSAVVGFADSGGAFLKSVAVLAKKIDDNPELLGPGGVVLNAVKGKAYEGQETNELATYQLGESLERSVRDLVGSNVDLEQELGVGQAPAVLGQVATFILGGWATKAPKVATVILGAGMTASDAYDEVRANGGTDDEAVNAGLIAGALLGPTELIGMRGAMKAIEGTARATTWKAALKTALREGRRDVVENIVQEIGQEFGQGVITGNTRDLEQLFNAGVLGGIGGAGTAPLSLVTGRPKKGTVNANPEVHSDISTADEVELGDNQTSLATTPTIERLSEPDAGDKQFAGITAEELQGYIDFRPKKGTSKEKRSAFTERAESARAELQRRAAETPNKEIEPPAAAEAQHNEDIPSFKDFVENYPRGGIQFETLSPMDPLFQERADEYVQTYGRANVVTKPSTNVTRDVTPAGIEFNGPELIKKNRKLLDSKSFREHLLLESVSGNAGTGRAAVNAAVDRQGTIVSLGNLQDLSKDVQERLRSGEFVNVSFIVKDALTDSPQIERAVVQQTAGTAPAEVKSRWHIDFEDPSRSTGTPPEDLKTLSKPNRRPSAPAPATVLDIALNPYGADIHPVVAALKKSKYLDAFLTDLGAGAEALDNPSGTALFRAANGDLVKLRAAYKEEATYGESTGGFIVEREKGNADPPTEPTKREIASAESQSSAEDPLRVPTSLADNVPGTKHDFSSTQVNLPSDLTENIKRLAKRIPAKDLADNGREDNPHVTVKFGLHTADAADVRAIVEDEPPIKVKIGSISTFPPSSSSGGAEVLKLDVDSKDLHRLNKKIADALPHTDTHPDYKPHITLAYVKPGLAEKFAGKKHPLVGREITIDRLTFSGKNGELIDIPLKGDAQLAKTRDRLKGLQQRFAAEIADVNKKRDAGRLSPEEYSSQMRIVTDRLNDEREGLLASASLDLSNELPKFKVPEVKEREPRPQATEAVEEEVEEQPTQRVTSNRASFAPDTQSISEAVRALGGIRVDKGGANSGEVARLTSKELGSPGLVNNTTGHSAEEMAMMLAQEGYRGNWVSIGENNHGQETLDVNGDAFLAAVEADASGVQISHSNAYEEDFSSTEREHWLSQMTPEEQEQYLAEEKFAKNDKVIESLQEIANGRSTNQTYQRLRAAAQRYGLDRKLLNDHISWAQGEWDRKSTSPEVDRAEDSAAVEDADDRASDNSVKPAGKVGGYYPRNDSDDSTHRKHPLPEQAAIPISSMGRASALKAHPDYAAAKAGDVEAANRLVREFVTVDNIELAREAFGADAVLVPLHAIEATGKNRIPVSLAAHYAAETGWDVDSSIVQTNQTFHTGGNAMERLVSRPTFTGEVEPGRSYVLVDDVVTLGGTIAEAAEYIQRKGGEVAGTIVLANASRTGTLRADPKNVRILEERYGKEIRELFNVAPAALTAPEASYLIGFKSADALRNRAAAARQENLRRASSKVSSEPTKKDDPPKSKVGSYVPKTEAQKTAPQVAPVPVPPPAPPAPPPPGTPSTAFTDEEILAEVDRILADPQAKGYLSRLHQYAKRLPRELQRTFTAEFTPLKTAEREILGGKQRLDLAAKAELLPGASGKAELDLLRFQTRVVAPVAKLHKDFNHYLLLRRTIDRLQTDANRKKVADWTIAKAEQGLQALHKRIGDVNWKRLEKSAAAFQEELDATLKLRVEAGLISQRTYDAIKESSDFYAPFKVMKYVVEGIPTEGGGRRIPSTEDLIDSITGINDQDFQLQDFLLTAAQQIYQTRILAEKNNFMRSDFAPLADADAKGELIRPVKLTRHYKVEFKPAEDILSQLSYQSQPIEQSFIKVGKAIQFAEESGMSVKRKDMADALGRATLGGMESNGRVLLRAFTSEVIAHELGHTADVSQKDADGNPVFKSRKVFGVRRDIMQRVSSDINSRRVFQKEMSELVDYTKLGGDDKYRASAKERFAEFMALYIHNPKKARELAPKWTDHFELKLLNVPEVKSLVNSLAKFYQKVDGLPNIKTPLRDLDGHNYLETAIRRAFPDRAPVLAVAVGDRGLYDVAKAGYQIVKYLDEGKIKGLEVRDDIAKALEGLSQGEASIMARTLLGSATLFKLGATGGNLAFQAANIVRDTKRALQVSKYGIKANPIDLPIYVADWIYSFATAVTGNFGYKNKLYQDFMQSGAFNSSVQRYLTPNSFRPTMGVDRASLPRKLARNILKSPLQLASAIEETSKLLGIRRGFRLEGFDKLSPEEQHDKMREIASEVRRYSGSPDFWRHGTAMTGTTIENLNLLFMFVNARIQGRVLDWSRYSGLNGGTRVATKALVRLAIFTGLKSLTLALFNLDDDDITLDGPEGEWKTSRRDNYNTVPDWERNNYYLIPRSNYFTNDRGERLMDYIRIPKDDADQLVGNTIEAAVRFAYEQDPESVKKFAGTFLENLSPINVAGNSLAERAESVVGSMHPVIKTGGELVFNRDTFRHRKIVPDYIDKVPSKDLPPSEQYTRSTAKAFVMLGYYLNVSPLILQHFTQGMTAGLVTQFLPPRQSPGRSAILSTPVIGSIARRFVRSESTAKESDNDILDEALKDAATKKVTRNREAYQLYESWKKTGDGQGLKDYLEERGVKPDIASQAFSLKEDDDKNLTTDERAIKQLGVENGDRAEYLKTLLKGKSDVDRQRLIDEWKAKGLASPDVVRQLQLSNEKLREQLEKKSEHKLKLQIQKANRVTSSGIGPRPSPTP